MPDSWPNLSSETLTDQVYEVLREQILSGRWEHGRFMREQQISEKLGVSRTPVREALGRLASDRFVERVPRRGACRSAGRERTLRSGLRPR
jgi:DNA-binding GntR family transcriptional regulator